MKRIAITMGDPGGVGPEVALRALTTLKIRCEFVLVGDSGVLAEANRLLGRPLKLKAVKEPRWGTCAGDTVQVMDVSRLRNFKKNCPSPKGGKSSAASIKQAVELAMDGTVQSIVTAPISKEALRMAGLKWPGHTEMLAELTATKEFGMMLMGGSRKGKRLRVVLATIHEPIKNVPRLITKTSVLRAVRLSALACRMLSIKDPLIAVSGLNPHAGESGMFGDEEKKIIIPAIRKAADMGIPVSGPYPPDTIFHRAYRGEFDIVVSMYHDQGLIPLKMMVFDRGVNVTLGLPFIRTSPDHGTAYDIAWQGKANSRSMCEAIKAAVRLKPVMGNM
jgi:4-hydroxythreonine-4-phosphate dehydrogenase